MIERQRFDAAMAPQRWGHTWIRLRYPLLIKAMCWVAILTESEAISAIQSHKLGDDYACEAVHHYGGVRKVLTQAWKHRHVVARMRGMGIEG